MMTSREFMINALERGEIMIIPNYQANDMFYRKMSEAQSCKFSMDCIEHHITQPQFAFVGNRFHKPLCEAGQVLIEGFELGDGDQYAPDDYFWAFEHLEHGTFIDFALDILEPWICEQYNLIGGRVISRQEQKQIKSLKQVNFLGTGILSEKTGIPLEILRAIEQGRRALRCCLPMTFWLLQKHSK